MNEDTAITCARCGKALWWNDITSAYITANGSRYCGPLYDAHTITLPERQPLSTPQLVNIELRGGPCAGYHYFPRLMILGGTELRIALPNTPEYVPELEGIEPSDSFQLPRVALYERVVVHDDQHQPVETYFVFKRTL